MWNRRNCETLKMNMLNLETTEVETAVLAYAGDQYQRNLPSFVLYSGTLGNNYCRCVSNQKTGIATSFKKHQCFCSDALFAMCEYKAPKGKENILIKSFA